MSLKPKKELAVWGRLRSHATFVYAVEFDQPCNAFVDGLAMLGDMEEWLAVERNLIRERDFERAPLHHDGMKSTAHFLFVFADKAEAALFKLAWG